MREKPQNKNVRHEPSWVKKYMKKVHAKAKRVDLYIVVHNIWPKEWWCFYSVVTGKEVLRYWPKTKKWTHGKQKGKVENNRDAFDVAETFIRNPLLDLLNERQGVGIFPKK